MKRTIFVTLLLALCAAVSLAQTSLSADQVVEKSRNRLEADTVKTLSSMVITGKKGDTRNLIIEQYSKDDAAGNSRTLISFPNTKDSSRNNPKSVVDTRFLTLEREGAESDQWIYLPEMGKTRRIAGSAKSGAFMGTDMSYDDIDSANRSADKDTHRIVKEETYKGNGVEAACYVIESVPKDKTYQYSKMLSWIDKSTFTSYRIELYDKKGAHVKDMAMWDFADKQGRLTPLKMRVSTLTKGTNTLVTTDSIEYDGSLPEGLFTTKYLETGRL